MSSTVKKLGLGTLGLSGKYLNVDERLAGEILNSISGIPFDFLDSSSVYNEHGYSVDEIILKSESLSGIDVFYKIGADPEKNSVPSLIEEFFRAQGLYACRLRGIMLHRTALDLIDEHSRFFHYIRDSRPDILFGISTFSSKVFSAYCDVINPDLVQAPLNIIDFEKNSEIFRIAKRRGITTQARSCLASGLLSGKYRREDVDSFRDTIRSRYSSGPRQRKLFESRMSAIEAVINYVLHLKNFGKIELSMPVFCYSVIANLDLVDHLIVGGTSKEQFAENASLVTFPTHIWNEILSLIGAWQADSL